MCLLRISAIVGLMTIILVGPSFSQDVFSLSCAQLWYQRNSIFKAAGYCFHTPRAIRIFGNAGCGYDEEADVPLSERDRHAIDLLHQVERMKRCPE